MDIVEFIKTNYTPIFQEKNIKLLDFRAYYNTIAARNNLAGVRTRSDYQGIQNLYYDVTMSCNPSERTMWIEHFMLNAIAYGFKTLDKCWILYFLAAWDMNNTGR